MGTSRERIKSGRTGFLAIVELKIANPPMIHSSKKGEGLIFMAGLGGYVTTLQPMRQGDTALHGHLTSRGDRDDRFIVK
jgi:hypothetical protein